MSLPTYILGIHDGHNCGASLSRNGRIVASVSEERLSRSKNEVGYPAKSIEEVLRIEGIESEDLSEVAYASLFMHQKSYLTELESWYCVGIEEQRADFAKPREYQKVIFEQRKTARIEAVCNHLSIPSAKVFFVEHHLAHLTAAYFTAPNVSLGQRILGLTCDGAGDGLAGSVSVCSGNNIERIGIIDRHASLGKIYSRVTMLLGMTPWEHEYKLMGMAPYADPERADIAADTFRNLLKLSDDKTTFVQNSEISMNYCYNVLRESFERIRFDTLAGATQLFTEEMLVDWVRGCIKKTGISDIVAGGGVFMNVKANMLIAQLPEVTSFYVMPSGADESLSIGACLHRYYYQNEQTDHSESVFENLYLGGEFTKKQEERAILKICDDNIEVAELEHVDGVVADLLAEGEVVARARGKMEWGARALGNRSILVSGHDYRVVDQLNQAIKQRDFWMPFAPSVLEESAHRYFSDPKNLRPYFMTHTFETNNEGRDHLSAGTHPRDHTIRAQVVTEKANPDYHGLLSSFEMKTGRGGLVNTSFNLHGEPIVHSPEDAIRVLKKSGLKHLALGHFLLSKKTQSYNNS